MRMCQVYEAEKVVTRTRVYHRSCLACSVCSRGLEAATATEAGDGRVYCRGCYSRHCCTTLYCTLHRHYTDPGSSAAWSATGTGRGRGCGRGPRRRGAPGAGTRCSAWTRCTPCSMSPVQHLVPGGGGPGPAVPPPVPLLRHLRHPAHPRQPQPRPGRGHPLREVLQRQVTGDR